MAQRRPRTLIELGSPLRVVVPSASLRRHVAARLVAELGATAGVIVQTAYGAALEVLERAGEQAPCGDPVFELLVRREVASEADLGVALAAFDDGAGVVQAAVRDLLDAGFGVGHIEGVLDSIEAVGAAVAAERRERAAAVVRVAAKVAAGLAALETDRTAAAVVRARELLRSDPRELLPCGGVLVHGFADVTGLVADWLEALVAGRPGCVILDRPPAPRDPGRDDPGVVFLDRLESRFGGLPSRADQDRPAVPAITTFTAPSRAEEAREVAHRVRRLLDDGVAPETIGIVARRLESSAAVLRDQLQVLGIPFSGVGATVPGGWPRRRLGRLLQLLDGLASATLEELEEASWTVLEGERLRLALRVLGATRVADVAAVPPAGVPATGVVLPLLGSDEDEPTTAAGQVVVPAAAVSAAIAASRRLLELDAGWPGTATAAEHRRRTAALVAGLGWPADAGEHARLDAAADEVVGGLPPELELTRQEWRQLLAPRLSGAADVPVGGRGGGVQVVTVTESRGRTFRALFVIGLARGEFPRVVADDPVLPDAIRRRLAHDVLEAMPVRARGAAEESYLFAQLVSSAPTVCCSWAAAEGGRRAAGSPLVERLAAPGGPAAGPPPVPGDRRRPATALERALAGGGRSREESTALLAAALAEGAEVVGADLGVPAAALAEARLAVVDAAEAAADGSLDGPWWGRVGEVINEPAAGPWVTALEATAECPWRAFVTRRLGVRPMPDPRAGVLDLDRLLVGQVVHRVLQRIVDLALGERVETVGRATTRTPQPVAWPEPVRVTELTEQAAVRVAAEAGLGVGRIAHLLAAAAAPALEVAREVAWLRDGHPPAVLGAELWGEVELAQPDVTLRFRADRVDAGPEGLEAVDYKTGRPVSEAVRPDTRRRHLLARIAAGRTLQAAAYALCLGGSGRYVSLRADLDDLPEGARVAVIEAGDGAAEEAFRDAVAAILAVRRTGAMFPRVEDPGSPDTLPLQCRLCAVTEACRRDDSAFRRRLVAGLSGPPPEGDGAIPAARRLWFLGTGGDG